MRLTAKDAAERLGISPRAVRLRLQKGTLAGFKTVDEATGVETWFVELPDDAIPPQEAGIPAPEEGDSQGIPTLDQVGSIVATFQEALSQLHRENLELAGRCGYYQAQVQELQNKVALLEAPKAAEEPRKPWWKVW